MTNPSQNRCRNLMHKRDVLLSDMGGSKLDAQGMTGRAGVVQGGRVITFSNTFHHIDARKYLPGQKLTILPKKRTRFLETVLKEPASTRLTPQGGRRIYYAIKIFQDYYYYYCDYNLLFSSSLFLSLFVSSH